MNSQHARRVAERIYPANSNTAKTFGNINSLREKAIANATSIITEEYSPIIKELLDAGNYFASIRGYANCDCENCKKWRIILTKYMKG